MPTGAVNASTVATLNAPDDGQSWLSVSLPRGALVNGTNVVAVEIHQGPASNDLSFDMELSAERAPVEFPTPAAPTGLRGSAAGQDSVSLVWNEVAGASEYRVLRDGVEVGSATAASFVDIGLSPGTMYTYSVRARNAAGTSVASSSLSLTTEAPAPLEPLVLLASGSVWRYNTSGVESPDWASPNFSDSSWPMGPSQIGHGEGDEATAITAFEPNGTTRRIVTYLRATFDIPKASDVTSLPMRIKRDDGVVVYVNGTEAYRSNMPSGPVTATTLATTYAPDDGQTWLSATLPRNLLVDGANTIAVSLHQDRRESLDLSFDMELTAVR
jgi:hypothetical protein